MESVPLPPKDLSGKIIGGKYMIEKLISKTSFSDVYYGIFNIFSKFLIGHSIENKCPVAIKLVFFIMGNKNSRKHSENKIQY